MKSFKRLVLLDVGMGSDRPFLPLIEDENVVSWSQSLKEGLKEGDILVFEGGVDIDPALYGEKPHPQTQYANKKRDATEIAAFEAARRKGLPMIGICRGAQLFTAILGGKLIQHVHGHLQDHEITVDDPNDAFTQNYLVTSCHHQMMVPPKEHVLIGWSNAVSSPTAKLEPEVVYYPQAKALAIQSHPEWMNINDPFVVYCRSLVNTLLGASNA